MGQDGLIPGDPMKGVRSGVDGWAFRFGRAGVNSLVMLLAAEPAGEFATATARGNTGLPGVWPGFSS